MTIKSWNSTSPLPLKFDQAIDHHQELKSSVSMKFGKSSRIAHYQYSTGNCHTNLNCTMPDRHFLKWKHLEKSQSYNCHYSLQSASQLNNIANQGYISIWVITGGQYHEFQIVKVSNKLRSDTYHQKNFQTSLFHTKNYHHVK